MLANNRYSESGTTLKFFKRPTSTQSSGNADYELKNRERLAGLLSLIPSYAAPDGWQQTGFFAVGGLAEVGFSKNSELLLVVSSSGRGVIDCATGARIARDDESYGNWYVPETLQCVGIGPLADETVQIAGLHGGGLPIFTRSGESLTVVSPDWPRSNVIFCPADKIPLADGYQTGCCFVGIRDEIRAFGFSWTGNSFVIATSSDVCVFTRNICS